MFMSRLSGAIAQTISDAGDVKQIQKEISEMTNRLRNTPQFAKVFHALITDPSHPPRFVEFAYQSGEFWSENWESSTRTYEPYTTCKYADRNIAYVEGCAIYLLLQECYPNVFTFKQNTITQFRDGATNKLYMNEEFVGKAIKPVILPPHPQGQSIPKEEAKFCPSCGSPVSTTHLFCGNCGNKL